MPEPTDPPFITLSSDRHCNWFILALWLCLCLMAPENCPKPSWRRVAANRVIRRSPHFDRPLPLVFICAKLSAAAFYLRAALLLGYRRLAHNRV